LSLEALKYEHQFFNHSTTIVHLTFQIKLMTITIDTFTVGAHRDALVHDEMVSVADHFLSSFLFCIHTHISDISLSN